MIWACKRISPFASQKQASTEFRKSGLAILKGEENGLPLPWSSCCSLVSLGAWQGPVHLPRDPAACIFSGCVPTRLHKKHALIGDLPLGGEQDASGVFCCSCLLVLFRSFLREAFKKSTVTLISEYDLSGLSCTSLDSWATLCSGCYLGILTKMHVEEPKSELSTGLGAEGTAGEERGWEEGMAVHRASPDGGASSPQN